MVGHAETQRGAPTATIERLCRYQQVLAQLERDGVKTVSSGEIGRLVATNAAQVRKDLSHFGEFGTRGLGYSVTELRARLRGILGLGERRNIAIIGAGNLGSALADYPGFEGRGFNVIAVFDNNPAKIGHRRHGMRVRPLGELATVARETGIDIAVIAVPEPAAQSVADTVIAAGVSAILNFAPKHLHAPPQIVIRNVNMTSQLEYLSYFLALGEGPPEEGA
jgi:redox-sensing transcriptional repressor